MRKTALRLLMMGVGICLGSSSFASNELVVQSESIGPVIGPDHPDVRASKNQSGFETGQVLKQDGVYHMFVNEMTPKARLDMRIAHWTSKDSVEWRREGTILDSVHGRSSTNLRSEVWVTGMAFNEADDCWNMFYVAYRGGDTNKGEKFYSDYEGIIWRAASQKKGRAGIGGPYKDMGILMRPDENSQKWEGQQGVDSFFPYQVGEQWYALYGSHNHKPWSPWLVGLASAPALTGPWKRMATGNPLSLVKVFTENPVAVRLADGRWLAIFDSYGDQEIGYSISADGIVWPPEIRLKVQTGGNCWTPEGDHALRTPLGIVTEDDGTFTVLYTAKTRAQSIFYAIGRCKLGWKSEK